MKFNKKNFEKFVLSEARKLAIEKDWMNESDFKDENIIFEEVEPNKEHIVEESKKETKEAKTLVEELKRMKQLLDFRNPLLGEKK